jgi:hypothetical protein
MDAAALADLLREAEEYHGHYEPVAIAARQQGRSPDEAYHDASIALHPARG